MEEIIIDGTKADYKMITDCNNGQEVIEVKIILKDVMPYNRIKLMLGDGCDGDNTIFLDDEEDDVTVMLSNHLGYWLFESAIREYAAIWCGTDLTILGSTLHTVWMKEKNKK